MNNRLKDLEVVVPDITINKPPTKIDEVVEMQNMDVEIDEFLKEFNKEVAAIENNMSDVRKYMTQIKDLQNKSLIATENKQRKELKEELNTLMTTVSGRNKEISASLTKIKNDTEARKEALKKQFPQLGDNPNTAEIRLREGQESQLLRDFQKIIADYQEMQAENKRMYAERAKRNAKIANPKLTEDQLNELVENGDINEDVFLKRELTGSQKETLNTYYDEAVETRREVLLIEASLIELQDLFIAMAQLVAQQDDLIDNIENNVSASVAHVNKGIEHTKQAKKYQEKSRWVMLLIILIVIILVVVGVVVVVVAAVTVPSVLSAYKLL